MKPKQFAWRCAALISAALLASCELLPVVGDAPVEPQSAAGHVGVHAPAQPASPDVEPKASGGIDYLTFVQEAMAASAKLSENKVRAGRATRAATAWRGDEAEGGAGDGAGVP